MEHKERAGKDLIKLRKMMDIFVGLGLDRKYPAIFAYASDYAADAGHFFDKGDYFTSFGAANYAYGFIDAIMIIEGKKDDRHIL
jgi:hypothetical protein